MAMAPKVVCFDCHRRFSSLPALSRHSVLHQNCALQFNALICSINVFGEMENVCAAAVAAFRTHFKAALLRSTNGAARVAIGKRVYETTFATRDYLLILAGTRRVTLSSRGEKNTYEITLSGRDINGVLDGILGADWDTAQPCRAIRGAAPASAYYFLSVSPCGSREYDLTLKLKEETFRVEEHDQGERHLRSYQVTTLRVEYWRGMTTRPFPVVM